MDFNYNSKNKDCYNLNKIIYIVYFIILFAIIYLVYIFIYFKNESFENININTNNNNKEQLANCIHSQKELDKIKKKIIDRINQREKAIYIQDNFYKINSDTFIDSDYINLYFNNQTFPSKNLSDYKIVSNDFQLSNI